MESSSWNPSYWDDHCLILIHCNKIITRKKSDATRMKTGPHTDEHIWKHLIALLFGLKMCVLCVISMERRANVLAKVVDVCIWGGFVTRSLIGFKFELNWPEDIFWFLSIVQTAMHGACWQCVIIVVGLCFNIEFSDRNDALRQDKGIFGCKSHAEEIGSTSQTRTGRNLIRQIFKHISYGTDSVCVMYIIQYLKRHTHKHQIRQYYCLSSTISLKFYNSQSLCEVGCCFDWCFFSVFWLTSSLLTNIFGWERENTRQTCQLIYVSSHITIYWATCIWKMTYKEKIDLSFSQTPNGRERGERCVCVCDQAYNTFNIICVCTNIQYLLTLSEQYIKLKCSLCVWVFTLQFSPHCLM